MCLPLAALPLAAAAASSAASAGSAIMSYFGAQSAHHAAVQSANLNYNAKLEQSQRENVQLSEQEGQNNLTSAVQQAQAFGRIATSAASLGLGQYSTHQVLSADAATYNRTMGINDQNYDNKRVNLQTEMEGAGLQRNSEIAAAPRSNLGSLALGLIGSAGQGASTYAAVGGRFGVQGTGAPTAAAGSNADGSMFFG